MEKKTVVVGMSGGVDSSVSALLLKQQGYNVVGLFMKNWEEQDDKGHCTAEEDYEDVRKVCNKIGIPYYTVNFSKEYMDNVFSAFLRDYEMGRTPNPDVLCNREVKFKPFLKFAKSIGADFIATGHYAQIEHCGDVHFLLRAVDENKDQTYFLNQLSQSQLKDVLFPIGHLEKPEVRKIAEENGLVNASKKDSTGICFIGERNFREFLQGYIPSQKGQFQTLDGKVLGEHEGSMYYTIGQRKGLNIGGVKGDDQPGRWFVVDKDIKNNIVYVSHDEKLLLSSSLVASDFNFIPCKPSETKFKCKARYRHRQPLFDCEVELVENKVIVTFDQPQSAVNVGQYVVLYDQDKCLGGGYIDKTQRLYDFDSTR